MMAYPDVVVGDTLEPYLRAIGQCRAHILPWSPDAVRDHSVDTSASSEAEVFPIRTTLDHGRIMSPAVASARTPVRERTSQRYQEEEDGEHGVGGRSRRLAVEDVGNPGSIILEKECADPGSIYVDSLLTLSTPSSSWMDMQMSPLQARLSPRWHKVLGTPLHQSPPHSACI